MRGLCALWVCGLLALVGCGTARTSPAVPPATKETPPPPRIAGDAGRLEPASWSDLPDWRGDDPAQAWGAFQASCGVLESQESWRDICSSAALITSPDSETARRFFEVNLTPFLLTRPSGEDEGLMTGYYEPSLSGSRSRSERYRHPLYGVPADLLVVDLSEAYPELKGMRLRGRLDGRRVVPYYDRAQIEQGPAALSGTEIAWVDDAIELFFLQIQGSGRIELESGETLRVGYADQNGFPYRSIGAHLVERGELTLESVSMQSIQAWARAHPDEVPGLLNHNASYVFFRELPAGLPGPLGSLGVPLTSQRSVAVDPAVVPLGSPVYVATTQPSSGRPLNRLMLAQDTGGAIRGPLRADFFWGSGRDAALEAGRMRQPLRMWVLLPRANPRPLVTSEAR
jgi:membrane-bound lytic murein transglycosylase A